MSELGRHHSDDCVAVFINANPAADHMRVATELAFPKGVADDNAIHESRHPIRLSVDAAQSCLRAQHFKIIRRCTEHLDSLNSIAARQCGACRSHGAKLSEHAGAIA